jgi:hypothetical protein
MKYLLGVLLAFTVVFNACQKEDQSLGQNLLPGIKLIETRSFKDSTSITAYTFTDDSIRVEKPRYSLLGSFNDPVFGYTNAAFSAQFRMPYYPRYEKDATLDSLILQMSYKYVYGDTISTQTVQVRELADSLQYDAAYYSTYKIRDHAFQEVLGSNNFVPKFRYTSTDTTAQIIRVRLNPAFGTRLLKMDSLNMVSNAVFLKSFKGLLIETAPLSRKGALMKIDATSSVLVLHYHTAAHDTLGFAYRVSDNSAKVSGYLHDYSTTAFYQNLNKQTGTDSLVYLQPTGGTKVLVNIPSISKWKDSTNYIINKATLSFRIDPVLSDMKRYEIPPQIYLKYIGVTKTDPLHEKEIFPADADLSAIYYGGFYNSVTESYDFNITQHFQKVVQGLKNGDKLYLVAAQRNSSPGRVVLKSGFSSKPILLNVIYTRFKQ